MFQLNSRCHLKHPTKMNIKERYLHISPTCFKLITRYSHQTPHKMHIKEQYLQISPTYFNLITTKNTTVKGIKPSFLMIKRNKICKFHPHVPTSYQTPAQNSFKGTIYAVLHISPTCFKLIYQMLNQTSPPQNAYKATIIAHFTPHIST